MYRIITIKELADILRKHAYEERFSIDFTMDQDLESDPSGWYGVEINNTFDGGNILFGLWGGGIDMVRSTTQSGISYDRFCNNLEEYIIEYFIREGGGIPDSYDENTLLCIDEEANK